MPTIGQLKDRIEIQGPVLVDDGSGGKITSWVSKGLFWGLVQSVKTEERFEAMKVDQEITHKITIRRATGIERGDRVIVHDTTGERFFEVDGARDTDNTRRWVEIMAKEIIP